VNELHHRAPLIDTRGVWVRSEVFQNEDIPRQIIVRNIFLRGREWSVWKQSFGGARVAVGKHPDADSAAVNVELAARTIRAHRPVALGGDETRTQARDPWLCKSQRRQLADCT
jgi:hypothetical protein